MERWIERVDQSGGCERVSVVQRLRRLRRASDTLEADVKASKRLVLDESKSLREVQD